MRRRHAQRPSVAADLGGSHSSREARTAARKALEAMYKTLAPLCQTRTVTNTPKVLAEHIHDAVMQEI